MSRSFQELESNVDIVDSADATKKINFDISGSTASTATTLNFNQTANRNISFPDDDGALITSNQIVRGSENIIQTTETLTTNIVFSSPFSSTPVAVITPKDLNENVSFSTSNVSTTDFDVNSTVINYVTSLTATIVSTSVASSFISVVNGNPAVAYEDGSNSISYSRANDSLGTTWGAPVVVGTSVGGTFPHVTMTVVNGNPAICYRDVATSDIKFVRALDVNGTAWGVPVIVTAANNPLENFLFVVNGFPAVSFYRASGGDLMYVRALDANGVAWGAPVVVASTGNVGLNSTMAIVNGFPAISYGEVASDNLNYVRALDINGAAWGAPVVVDSTARASTEYAYLKVINGNPAISYRDGNTGDLRYIRANSVDGSTWGTPYVLVDTNIEARISIMDTINGFPGISYVSSAGVAYIEATDIDGTAWGNRKVIINSTPLSVGLTEVNSQPAVIYGGLEYILIGTLLNYNIDYIATNL